VSEESKIAGAPSGHVPPAPEQPAPAAPAVEVAPAPPVVVPSAPPAPQPIPAAAQPPAAPAAAPEPAAEAKPVSEVDALRAEVEAELQKARTAREALEAVQQRQQDKARIAYLRQMGASEALTDEHLLTLAPAVDSSSADGAAALQAWQQSNAALFSKPQEGATTTAKLVERFATSKHGTFGADFHAKQMRATFGGE
jgi:hypothetical protein